MFKILANSRTFTARFVVLLFAVTLCGACGDPGTGGSGVPSVASGTNSTANNGANSEAPGTGSGVASPTAPLTDASTPPTQGTSGAVSTPAAEPSTYGIVESPLNGGLSAQPGIEIRVAGIRFDITSAVLVGTDGQSRNADRLQAGVPIRLSYASTADLAAAAVGANGPAIRVSRVTLVDPLPGQLINDPVPSRVLLDNGNTVPLSAQVVIFGSAGPANRVRAWVFSDANVTQATRIEFE